LEPSPEIAKNYPKSFRLAYVVTLAEHQLATDLHVKNTSTDDVLEFQALFHNYIQAPSDSVLVTPLQGVSYKDKTDSSTQDLKTESRAGVDVKKFTDSVYTNAPQKYEVIWPGGGLSIRSQDLKDVVVWNPQAEAGSKIGDMEEGGWERFICVEPGYVDGFQKISAGVTWIGGQVLTVIHEERL
ncbi:hypothetical protein V5O48_010813, partial [Marasmius crinis-equi]